MCSKEKKSYAQFSAYIWVGVPKRAAWLKEYFVVVRQQPIIFSVLWVFKFKFYVYGDIDRITSVWWLAVQMFV